MKNPVKKTFIELAALLLAIPVSAANGSQPALIPWPQKVLEFDSAFKLMPQTRIYTYGDSWNTGHLLAVLLRQSTGYPFEIRKRRFTTETPISDCILLTTRNANTNLGPEGYTLTVTTNSAVIRAPTQAGLFYGTRTLLQLLPPELFSTNLTTNVIWKSPCVQIEDWPRFKWRGLMLDVSRHFYTKAEVEQILNLMALYKLNVLQWHLTDDSGWRIQIKKYPRLTQVGAWRKQSRIEPPSPNGANAHSAWMAPAADKFGSDGRYGGFYTPSDIHEVVAYAAARHITIVPEIEMPGHSAAALKAYPQLGCTDLVSSASGNVYCPANPATFTLLENVLREVFRLFPGPYVHIGGDEVKRSFWRNSPECQGFMKREGLKNTVQLQNWFIKRMERFVEANGKIPIGWGGISPASLTSNAVVMDWIGGAREAAITGHNVVMTPTAYCYFDYYQSTNHTTEPQAIGGYTPLRKVYSFEPIPKGLPQQDKSHILGAQANLWTEYIASLPHVEYMLFPRLCALAEVVWSPKSSRNWKSFQRRLKVDKLRLGELGVNYRQVHGLVNDAKRTSK